MFFGFDIPIAPKRGQILRLHVTPQQLQHILFFRGRYLVPRGDGTIVLGATAEDAGFDRRPTAAGVAYLLDILPVLVPQLMQATIEKIEVGFRPWSSDRHPFLGYAPGKEGLVLATGHGRDGILLSAITGQLIAKLILEQVDDIPSEMKVDRLLIPAT